MCYSHNTCIPVIAVGTGHCCTCLFAENETLLHKLTSCFSLKKKRRRRSCSASPAATTRPKSQQQVSFLSLWTTQKKKLLSKNGGNSTHSFRSSFLTRTSAEAERLRWWWWRPQTVIFLLLFFLFSSSNLALLTKRKNSFPPPLERRMAAPKAVRATLERDCHAMIPPLSLSFFCSPHRTGKRKKERQAGSRIPQKKRKSFYSSSFQALLHHQRQTLSFCESLPRSLSAFSFSRIFFVQMQQGRRSRIKEKKKE